MKRKARNLDEEPDFVLAPEQRMVRWWLSGGPSDGTHIEVPAGTYEVWVEHPAVEVALNPEEVLPRAALYQLDRNAMTGGFHVLAYVRSFTESKIPSTEVVGRLPPTDERTVNFVHGS